MFSLCLLSFCLFLFSLLVCFVLFAFDEDEFLGFKPKLFSHNK